MRRFVNDANTLLDHWRDASWLTWVAPVALMPVTQVVVRQRQEEEAGRKGSQGGPTGNRGSSAQGGMTGQGGDCDETNGYAIKVID